jgi:hypothetical protein
LLHDLGLEARMVGITKFCVHPYHLKSTKIVGGTKKSIIAKLENCNLMLLFVIRKRKKEMVNRLREICPVWVTILSLLKIIFK